MPTRDDQKVQIQQATDVVRLIGEHVALKPKGREFVGLCPFHDDKNPSMSVSPAKQIYKCFSCGAGGDVFTFVTQYHKMTFPEALKHLADLAGIKLERQGPRGQGAEGPSERQRIAAVNEQAVALFRKLYAHPEHGTLVRDYVQQRGISAEMIEAFQLGYAPDRWDGLATTIAKNNWDLDGYLMAGLVSPRKGRDGESPSPGLRAPSAGNCYDRLRHRLIFPICDALGRPIAFGGRKLRDEDEPKYLNSPETKLFNKSATLYGLHLAKKPIIDSKTAVIVEGYTDVIACHQHGAKNVVATLGTALTREHVGELRRYAEKVVLVFDADEAGQKAADRAVELFLTGELDVAIAVLPTGPDGSKLDPAELLAQEGGLDRWNGCVAEAHDALTYQFDRVRDRLEAADTVTGRQAVAEQYVTQLGQLGLSRMGAIRRALVVQRLAELLRMDESAVNGLLTAAEQRGGRSSQAAPSARPAPDVVSGPLGADKTAVDVARHDSRSTLKAAESAERQLVGCLIRDPGLFHHTLADGQTLDEALAPAELATPEGQTVYQRVYDLLCENEPLSLVVLLGDLAEHEDAGRPLARWLTDADAEVERATHGDAERVRNMLAEAAKWLLNRHRDTSYREVRKRALADDGNDERLIRELLDQRRAHPSPARIARPRS